MTTITSPIEGYNGKSVFGALSVEFVDGVAEVDKIIGGSLVDWLTARGYTVDGAPKTNAQVELESKPDDSWTNDKIKAYAEEHGIDLGDASKKAEYLAAIQEGKPVQAEPAPVKGVETDPGAVGPGDGTPATPDTAGATTGDGGELL